MEIYGSPLMFTVITILRLTHIQSASEGLNKGLVVVILSQNTPYHETLANNLRDDLLKQSDEKNIAPTQIHLSHEDFPHQGAWTFLPILISLSDLHESNSSWIFFCEDRTHINLPQLHKLLDQYDSSQEIFLGHGLLDSEPTIIHHFNDAPRFRYPLLRVGFAFSTALLNRLAARLSLQGPPEADFAIDSSYELSQFVSQSGRGTALTHSDLFCTKQEPQCVSYYQPFTPCNEPVSNALIHFAVKTCHRFHESRIPIVKQTWAKKAKNLVFYSDLKDTTIPTTDLGVPNTDRGHCGKTMAIVRHTAKMKRIKWLAIVDDDTLISVSRLQDLLSCYDTITPLGIGERYGFNVGDRVGYNYITGGGGILLNMAAVQLLANNCDCPSNSTPDDMYLGMCMKRLGIDIVHSSRFHQARPPDYSRDLLTVELPVSFHKHWMLDPLAAHSEWLDDTEEGAKHAEL